MTKENIFRFEHPLWSVGFRPFFILAFLSGAVLPILWALVFSGTLPWTSSFATSLQWHAHEMFYGFGWAVLGGFLLTASKNWVKIRGYHGGVLIFLTLAWALERVCFFLPQSFAVEFFWLGENIFLTSIVILLVWTLLRNRKDDTFPDNWYFIFALPLFIVAKNLLLSESRFYEGWMVSLGLFRLAFVVMLERTLPQFMKNSLQTEIKKRPFLDRPIKMLTFLSAFSVFLPIPVAALLLGVTGILLLLRFTLWRPLTGFRKFEIGLMYVGYLGIGFHFLAEVLRLTGSLRAVGDVSTHLFTFLAMGLIVSGMLTRISMGHTGRKLVFETSDKVAISALFVAAFVRLVLPQFFPGLYPLWMKVSALGWVFCFSLLAFRLIPFLLRPRVDGRVH